MSGLGVPDFSGMTSKQLIDKLRDDKPRCQICDKPCDPDKEVIRIIVVPIPSRVFDLAGLLPVHERCEPEARDRLKRAQDAIAASN